ncbi:hypothetical protein [Helicobacter pylori]|nr:hypothetical protein [Helicobacter pylori]
MRNYSLAYTSFFILIVKNPQRHQFDYRYSSEAPNRFSDWAS